MRRHTPLATSNTRTDLSCDAEITSVPARAMPTFSTQSLWPWYVCFATLISRLHAQSGYIALRDYELLKAFPGIDSHDCAVNIPIFANTQDIAALAIEVDEYLAERPDCPGYLIQGHGLYCWGNTLEDCMRNLEALEFMLHCELEMQRLKR